MIGWYGRSPYIITRHRIIKKVNMIEALCDSVVDHGLSEGSSLLEMLRLKHLPQVLAERSIFVCGS
jgi:hypothetical protein